MQPNITRVSHPEESSGHTTELEKIETIFHSALECEPAALGAFLDTACGGNESLRAKVEVLLKSYQQATDFIEKPPTAFAARLIAGEATEGGSMIGRTIGHYKITQHLGSGGMGEVYVALDTRSERKAVLKLLPARFTADSARIRRFQQEARALVALNHPNILTTYEIGEEDSTYYIVSELVEGETLRQRVDRHRLKLKDTIDVTIQVASALASAHEAGIVHRDIKPENIMLRRDGYVKVLDFGIAKLAEQELPSTIEPEKALGLVATHVGSILGTVRYMSPEQARGEPVDHRTDIWSLGVVLYEMVTGLPPFSGVTPQEIISAALTSEPAPIARQGTKAPFELQEIISRALQKDREERYGGMHEMLEALRILHRKLEFSAELEHAPFWLRWIRTPVALLLALLVVALAVSFPLFFSRSKSQVTESKPSIAVLPFENRSENRADAYLADGIQDEVLTRLANIADLKVISRTSTERYRAVPKNLREIAKELGVANILEGSVQKAGDQVRINVQLIKAQTDDHLWAQSYDQKLIDIFAVESEVARRVAETLSSKLTGLEKKRIETKPTNNPAAYDAYLRGLALATRANSLTLDQTVHFFTEAVRLDPTFATAWARLSITNSRLYAFDHLPSRRDAAKFALDKALELNADLGEVLLANGYYYYRVRNDFESAATAFREVLLRMPNNAEAISGLGWVARRQGKWTEALEQQNLGLQLDPENAYNLGQLYGTYFALKDFTAAHATEERVLKIDDNPESHAGLARLYLAQGDTEQAEAAIRGIAPTPELYYIFEIQVRLALITHRYTDAIRMLEAAVTHPLPSYGFRLGEYEYLLAFSQELAGNLAAARENYERARVELEKLRRAEPEDPDAAMHLGLVYAGLGDKAGAIREADDAVRLRPASADTLLGPGYEEGRARIQARVGETDSAITEVRRLLDVNYLGPEQITLTRAILRLDPIWDPLRGDPRFEKIVASLAPK